MFRSRLLNLAPTGRYAAIRSDKQRYNTWHVGISCDNRRQNHSHCTHFYRRFQRMLYHMVSKNNEIEVIALICLQKISKIKHSNVLITLVSTSDAHIAVCNRVVNENMINVLVDSLPWAQKSKSGKIN